jgi:uncharacterized protein YqhQ
MQTMSKSNEFNYGGQAVIEGVMMRGSKTLSVAVRNPAGDIVVHTEPLNARIYGGPVARLPFLRGLTLIWDALGLGIKSLMFSADVALVDEDAEPLAEGEERPNAFQGPAEWGAILISLSFSIALFFVLPVFLANLLEKWLGLTDSRLWGNFIEGMVRLALLVGYIWVIGFMPDIKRLYGYHGAEHKTINAYEAGAELTPASVAKYPLEHPRCGTAFLLTVVLISILLYTVLPPMAIWLRVLTRILFLPLIAGISYEFLRFTAVNQRNPIIRFITKPNLALQRLTTREPDEGMLAVAIRAFQEMRSLEEGHHITDAPVTLVETPVSEAI